MIYNIQVKYLYLLDLLLIVDNYFIVNKDFK